jgi:vitamin B12 transporter
LFITIGGRSDDSNQFGRHNTYKAGASLNLASWRSRVFGNYGTGFRSPTLNDLYYPGFSNPTLEPEESTGYEYGVTTDLAKNILSVGATRFRTKYDNLIALDSAFVPQNIAAAETSGGELSGTWTVSRQSTITGNYTVTDAVDSATGQHLLRRPHNKGNVVWTFSPDATTDFRIDYRVVGSRLDTTDGVTILTLPHYALVNLSGTQRVSATAEVFVRLENAFNRDYQEVAGYGTAGRSFYTGFTSKF